MFSCAQEFNIKVCYGLKDNEAAHLSLPFKEPKKYYYRTLVSHFKFIANLLMVATATQFVHAIDLRKLL